LSIGRIGPIGPIFLNAHGLIIAKMNHLG
jgi:hypothetical protein